MSVTAFSAFLSCILGHIDVIWGFYGKAERSWYELKLKFLRITARDLKLGKRKWDENSSFQLQGYCNEINALYCLACIPTPLTHTHTRTHIHQHTHLTPITSAVIGSVLQIEIFPFLILSSGAQSSFLSASHFCSHSVEFKAAVLASL